MHSFREEWLPFIKRKDFKPTDYTKICSLHFTPTDFEEFHMDTNNTRKRESDTPQLKCRRIKRGACPTIFPELPSYDQPKPLSSRKRKSNDSLATADARRQAENSQQKEAIDSFLDSDRISDFSDLCDRLRTEPAIPSGFTLCAEDKMVNLYLILKKNSIPCISGSVSIDESLVFEVVLDGKLVCPTEFKKICPEKIELFSQLTNLMGKVKSLVNNNNNNSENTRHLSVEILKM